MKKVKVWSEDVVIPTYEVGKPEKNPMFLEKRVYQGSSGVVYPYPVIEKIYDTPVDKSYNALYLENDYLKIMILPELGGRVQMAYDKIKGRHFVYCNHVIKPALVGLAGPWISGGIEINWPQHHRPSTFMPVDWTIEELPDGGATVWVNERERMFHQRGAAGFTLRPGVAYLEIQGRVYNPTPLPQTFLWWANPAVAVNDEYQSVFPPDVHAVFDHGKRDVSSFPIATGIYYKMDYSPGTDISRYRNIPVPTSYMAVRSDYDFVGGYENDTRAGLLHVANHNVSPGKKQWTWGNGDFGKAWDRNLTDADGPYIELMTGVYTDNQPDFSWLQPYEEKTFVQYFMPYRELGVVKNASKDLMLSAERVGGEVTVKVFATSALRITVELRDVFSEEADVSPEKVYEKRTAASADNLSIILRDAHTGRELLSWSETSRTECEIPESARAAKDPAEIETCEELFLTGQHIEQYRHATYDPTAYYREALRRDAGDIRNNNALGLWLLRHGKFAESEGYFRAAIVRQTERNPNPYDGEPYYNLGLSLKFQGRSDEAYEAFYKATWNSAWRDSGYFSLACISTLRGNFEEALREIELSLQRNWTNLLGRHLKTAILRKLGRSSDALAGVEESVKMDRFNLGCLFEKYLLTGSETDLAEFAELMRGDSHNWETIALDYLGAGLYEEVVEVLRMAERFCDTISPMIWYYMGQALTLVGRGSEAAKAFKKGAGHRFDYCFPNRPEAIAALRAAIEENPGDAKAWYCLGNLWYDKRQYPEAIEAWERSVAIDGNFPPALRNLALGYFNKLGRVDEAVELLERAFEADARDTRVLMELDQLYKRLNRPPGERLALLDKYRPRVDERDDLYLEYATLLNLTGRHGEAKRMIDARKFHPWEGGEGKVPAQYQIARMELAKEALGEERHADAVALLEECFVYPHNLGEGKLHGAQESDFNYWMGRAWEGLGDKTKAAEYFLKGTLGVCHPAAAIYYNDQKPDKIFYQGMSLLALGRKEEAHDKFETLVSYGQAHLSDDVHIDYFAVSLPDMLIWDDDGNLRNRVHCNYLTGLGYLGFGESEKARHHLSEALRLDGNHQGAQLHLKMLNEMYP
jgi:tetratricopeptide (TPR) repeat protein